VKLRVDVCREDDSIAIGTRPWKVLKKSRPGSDYLESLLDGSKEEPRRRPDKC
jgi:hypothetical protein